MAHRWEIAWITLQPLAEREVRDAVEALTRLPVSLPNLVIDARGTRYVAFRHRRDDAFLLEFGFAEDAPSGPLPKRHGLVENGRIVWNWCGTSGRQPETRLIVATWRRVQQITADKLLVWDDGGSCHWSWGSCSLEAAGLDPMAVVDAHLRHATLAGDRARAA